MNKNKVFYYTGKNYMNDNYIEYYERVSRWIKIDYNLQGEPFFRYKNKRYYLDNFLRVHYPSIDTMIITDTINALQSKEIIQLAGYESDTYYKPLFLEISDSGENVRLYRYTGTNKE